MNHKDLYNLIKQYRPSFDEKTTDPEGKVEKKDHCYYVEVTAGHGKRAPQNRSMQYLDFDKHKFLDISDKEAIEFNKDWDIAIRGLEIASNGGPYPGNIEVARVIGKGDTFDSFTKDDLTDLTFVTENPVDVDGNIILAGATGHAYVSTAVGELNDDTPDNIFAHKYWFTISIEHPVPVPKNDLYIFRNKTSGETVKFHLYQVDKDEDGHLTFFFKYALL